MGAGRTYRENVADTRETPVKDIIKELKEYGVEILGYDPLLDNIEDEFGIKAVSALEDISGIDCMILAAGHDAFKRIALTELRQVMDDRPVLIDVRGFFKRNEALERGFYYRTL